jgi:hypothetical protein
MTITSTHTKACFEAWINCENLLVNMAQVKESISKKVTKIIDECAFICMGTFHAMKSGSQNLSRFALLCVGICEECAEICESQSGFNFKRCARICRECSEALSKLTLNEG